MINLFRIALLASLLAASCKEKNTIKQHEEKAISGLTDTVTRDVPELYVRDTSYRRRVRDEEQAFGLLSLDKGFDGIQIRLWVGCNLGDSQDVIVLTNRHSQWEADFYFAKVKYNEHGLIASISKHSETRLPKSGWKPFNDSLTATGIENLPDYHHFLPKYEVPTDADLITVEIGKPGEYRRYGYPALGLNKQIQGGPAKLEHAIALIEREFDYKRPCER